MKGFRKFIEALLASTIVLTFGLGFVAGLLYIVSLDISTLRSVACVIAWITLGCLIAFITSAAAYAGIEQFVYEPAADKPAKKDQPAT